MNVRHDVRFADVTILVDLIWVGGEGALARTHAVAKVKLDIVVGRDLAVERLRGSIFSI